MLLVKQDRKERTVCISVLRCPDGETKGSWPRLHPFESHEHGRSVGYEVELGLEYEAAAPVEVQQHETVRVIPRHISA